jgi:S-methylmethionine-dependent homocysteine/selenocysteine methylase
VLLDTATWRANPDWAAELGYSPEELDDANRRAVALAEEIRAAGEDERTPIVINGVVGPRGDGYSPAELMSVEEPRATTPARSRPSPRPPPTW